MDVISLFLQYVNVPASLFGAACIQMYKYLTPGPVAGERSLETMPGKIWDRMLPFVGITTGTVASIALDWYLAHPELGGKSGIVPQDIVRGVLSGMLSDYLLRIYYKTVAGA